MLATADAAVQLATRRKRTGNGWNTPFIGKNRNTIGADEARPAAGVIYPMAFLVEKDAGAVVKPHFHLADQYQVVIQGGGSLGKHEIGTVAVHYTDAYSAYGPIIANDHGVSWFTLRNTWDSGALYMPENRATLREGRAKMAHREATCGPLPPLSVGDLAALSQTTAEAVIEETTDGLGTWRYTLPAGASVTGPAPETGGGQYWLVSGGSACVPGGALLSPQSLVFVGPDEAAPAMTAGPGGADLICMQFPKRARD